VRSLLRWAAATAALYDNVVLLGVDEQLFASARTHPEPHTAAPTADPAMDPDAPVPRGCVRLRDWLVAGAVLWGDARHNLHAPDAAAAPPAGPPPSCVCALAPCRCAVARSAEADTALARGVRDYQSCLLTDSDDEGDHAREAPRPRPRLRLLGVRDTARWHRRSAAWLRGVCTTAEARGLRVCVASHHAPVPERTSHPAHEVSALAGAFSGQLHWLLPRVGVWLAGHTHWSFRLRREGCLMLSNQRGYSGGECSFDPALAVTLADTPTVHADEAADADTGDMDTSVES
jgi:hypothetical protein